MGPMQDATDQLAGQYEKARLGLRAWVPPTVVALVDANYGLFLIAVAQLWFACMSTAVKYLMENTDMSVLTLIFVRMGITGVCCWATLLLQRDPYPFFGPPELRKLLAFRGLCGFFGLLCAYLALRGLSVSDAITIGFLTPTVTALLGYLLLGETFGVREGVAGMASLFGVILISRPPFLFGHHFDKSPPIAHPEGVRVHGSGAAPLPGEDEPSNTRTLAATAAVIGVFFSAGAYLTIRHIGKRANALHSISAFSLACTVTSGIAVLLTPGPLKWPNTTLGFVLIFVIGIFGFCAQAFLTFGLQREKAGRAGLAMYMQIFFAVILEFLVFQKIPSLISFCGMVIILSAAGWVAMGTLKSNPPKQVSDPESRPISREPSPVPRGTRTVRGESYSYASVPTDDPSSNNLRVPVVRTPSPCDATSNASSSATLNANNSPKRSDDLK